MNNEPVAWIDPKELNMDVSTSVTKHKQFDGDIPLYTHPAKTLTDEFIYKNHVGYLSPNNDFYAPDYPTWKQDGYTPIYKELVAKTLTDEEIDDVWAACSTGESDTIDMHLFAQAILRKAQEK